MVKSTGTGTKKNAYLKLQKWYFLNTRLESECELMKYKIEKFRND